MHSVLLNQQIINHPRSIGAWQTTQYMAPLFSPAAPAQRPKLPQTPHAPIGCCFSVAPSTCLPVSTSAPSSHRPHIPPVALLEPDKESTRLKVPSTTPSSTSNSLSSDKHSTDCRKNHHRRQTSSSSTDNLYSRYIPKQHCHHCAWLSHNTDHLVPFLYRPSAAKQHSNDCQAFFPKVGLSQDKQS